MTKPFGDGCNGVSENYSATYPAEQAGFFTYNAVKMSKNVQAADIVSSLFLLQNFLIKAQEVNGVNASIENYPKPCHDNINTIISSVKTDAETAYAMLLMTAVLMDLCPGDPKVAEIILDDCKGMRVVCKGE